jgi:HlyD family secretion protein
MQRKSSRKLRLTAALTIVAGATAAGLGLGGSSVPVAVAKVERRSFEVTIHEPGRTRIRQRYAISAPALGSLVRVVLEPGAWVEAGQVVAELRPMAPQLLDERTHEVASAQADGAKAGLYRARSAVSRARASLDLAETKARRARQLHAEGGVTLQSLEQAQYELAQAREELASAEYAKHMAKSEYTAARLASNQPSEVGAASALIAVRAPAAGRILRVMQESEGVVQPGTPLLEMGDPTGLELVVDVLSADAVRIVPGADATIEHWGGSGTLRARVRRVDPAAFVSRSALGVEEQRVPVVLDFLEEPARLAGLGDGYRVEANIALERLDDALVVPASALFRDDHDVWATYAYQAGVARRVEVQAAARTPDWVAIARGLAPGDQVVLYPSDEVRDGVTVAALPLEP